MGFAHAEFASNSFFDDMVSLSIIQRLLP